MWSKHRHFFPKDGSADHASFLPYSLPFSDLYCGRPATQSCITPAPSPRTRPLDWASGGRGVSRRRRERTLEGLLLPPCSLPAWQRSFWWPWQWPSLSSNCTILLFCLLYSGVVMVSKEPGSWLKKKKKKRLSVIFFSPDHRQLQRLPLPGLMLHTPDPAHRQCTAVSEGSCTQGRGPLSWLLIAPRLVAA